MDTLVYDSKTLPQAMGCSLRRAKSWLHEHGVEPIDLGKGRGGGLRWLRESVMEALHTMATGNAPKKKKTRVRHYTVENKTADALLREFNIERMPIQERNDQWQSDKSLLERGRSTTVIQ